MAGSIESVEIHLPSPFPWLLLSYAREAHQRLTERPDNRRYPGLQALMLTTMAAEAVVNRLLEPIIAADQWPTLERQGAGRKWTRLGRELQLSPALDEACDPLLGFVTTANVRNSIVHFQHGQNLQTLAPAELRPQQTGPTTTRLIVTMAEMRAVGPSTPEDSLRADRALMFFPSLERLLRTVLESYRRSDEATVVLIDGALRGIIEER